MIQDTTFVIDVLRGDDAALATLSLLEREARPQKLSAITVLELTEGLVRSGENVETREEIEAVLETKTVVAADREIMQAAGQLSGELGNRGEEIDREDCIVAATARRADEPVLTRTVDHFERVPDLDVRSY